MGPKGREYILNGILILLQLQKISCALQNIALGKSTSQKSPWKYSSRLAVDGDKNRHLVRGLSCTETYDVINPWWEVDLEGLFVIDYLRVHNRRDCCSSRLTDVLFEVSVDHVKYDFFYYRPGTVRQIEDIYPNATTIGRWVKVSMSRRVRLTLCELEVMSGLRIDNKNLFAVETLKRGSGEIIHTDFVNSLMQCAFLCMKKDDCFSVNGLEDASSSPFITCHMLNTLKDETTEDLNTTLIRVQTTKLD